MKVVHKEYSDWFGEGSTTKDFEEIVKEHGEPIKVWIDSYMLCLQYPNKIIVTGYDGGEYHHTWTFSADGEQNDT